MESHDFLRSERIRKLLKQEWDLFLFKCLTYGTNQNIIVILTSARMYWLLFLTSLFCRRSHRNDSYRSLPNRWNISAKKSQEKLIEKSKFYNLGNKKNIAVNFVPSSKRQISPSVLMENFASKLFAPKYLRSSQRTLKHISDLKCQSMKREC